MVKVTKKYSTVLIKDDYRLSRSVYSYSMEFVTKTSMSRSKKKMKIGETEIA